ncbi:uncharacterized protein LOC111056268 isoform X2 [Nilaparvata lugens]|uniref:uncharacterized protein LOC111056268 isoform X2 n=1 Tax=Nilaparvata lugens TaxID=108931 RepID=UPI00193D00A7|nr:uncharacterized protein LOC111056268 isoform X2 [Nilaparvata lugens]
MCDIRFVFICAKSQINNYISSIKLRCSFRWAVGKDSYRDFLPYPHPSLFIVEGSSQRQFPPPASVGMKYSRLQHRYYFEAPVSIAVFFSFSNESLDDYGSSHCNCLPACTELSYEVDSFTTPRNFQYFNLTSRMMPGNIVNVEAFFETKSVTNLQRVGIVTDADFIVSSVYLRQSIYT